MMISQDHHDENFNPDIRQAAIDALKHVGKPNDPDYMRNLATVRVSHFLF